MQVELDEKRNRREDLRNRMEDVRNELEKAYGPLYSILMRSEEQVSVDIGRPERKITLTEYEKKLLDDIMVKYPFMFPYKVLILWQNKIRDLTSFAMMIERNFAIPLEFRDKIKDLYDRRVQEYYQFTGRDKETDIISHPVT